MMLTVIAILWLLGLSSTVYKRHRQIKKTEKRLKSIYEKEQIEKTEAGQIEKVEKGQQHNDTR